MATIFTRILRGEEPARFVWRDARCGAFLAANPLRPGHTLVVPVEEVDHWLELDTKVTGHLIGVARVVGRAIQRSFNSTRVGLLIAGLEVPHVHVHLVPIEGLHDLDFNRQDPDPDPLMMDEAAEAIRAALRALGAEHVPD
jgi:histidine triad (HIT) family protein